jgi:ferredoxin-type protein NapF
MLRGDAAPEPRPPWSSETRIRAGCDSCGACLKACPEAILIPGPAGTPVVDFSRGGCIFCGDCARACPEAETVFAPLSEAPWAEQGGRIAEVGAGCMLQLGIACQLCTDSCETEALRIDLSVRPVGRIRLDAQACSGCGFCLQSCPAGAITLIPAPAGHDTKEPADA